MLCRRFSWLLTKHYRTNMRREYSSRNMLLLHERGMFQDLFPDSSSNDVIGLLNSAPQCVYAGFDPTADSLHVGNLLVLVNLIHWQRAGHRVIALVGGATGQIGDPSGRSLERNRLASEVLSENTAKIEGNIQRVFENHETHLWKREQRLQPITVVDNLVWYRNLNSVHLLDEVFRHFRVGTMLSRHSVQTRLTSDAGISLTEFCYQVMQAYDWLHLYRTERCRFQVGGSDQMGNIVSGHDLISRAEGEPVYGLTLPLVTTEQGDKFGKSSGNAVWLSRDKSSEFELYQFLVRTRDADVERLLKLFTFKSVGQIADIMFEHQKKPENRSAQKLLAEQVLLLVHGDAGLQLALDTTAALYSGSLESLAKMSAKDVEQVFHGAATCELLLKPGVTVLDAALQAGCFKTHDDALRIIGAGGFYVNQQRVRNCEEMLTRSVHILPNNISLIRVGKKNYHIIKWLT